MSDDDNNPKLTKYDNPYLEKALHDEPVFVLLARDPTASAAVRQWVCLNTGADEDKKRSARAVAAAMEQWRDDKANRVRVRKSQIVETLTRYSASSYRMIEDEDGGYVSLAQVEELVGKLIE